VINSEGNSPNRTTAGVVSRRQLGLIARDMANSKQEKSSRRTLPHGPMDAPRRRMRGRTPLCRLVFAACLRTPKAGETPSLISDPSPPNPKPQGTRAACVMPYKRTKLSWRELVGGGRSQTFLPDYRPVANWQAAPGHNTTYQNWCEMISDFDNDDPIFRRCILGLRWSFGVKYRLCLRRSYELFMCEDPVRYGLPPALRGPLWDPATAAFISTREYVIRAWMKQEGAPREGVFCHRPTMTR
jgi:hypothetical protein